MDQRLKFLYDPSGEFNFIPIPEGEDFLELIDHFRKMENRLRIITAAPGTITVSVDIKHLRALINALLSWFDFNKSQKKDVQKAVETALKKPYQYLEDHKEQLANRDIGEPVHNLFIIALVDAMQKLGAAVEVDWNTDFETVVWQVSGLAIPCKIISPQESKAPPLLVPDILRRLGKEIMAQGATLTTIDIDTDSYVLTVVPSTRYKKVVELAKKAGIKIDRF